MPERDTANARTHLDRRTFLRLAALAGLSAASRGGLIAGTPTKPKFELQILVDFYDDLLNSHFTEKTFREMMRIFRAWGITRVYWNGQSFASGLYDAETERRLDLNALLTFKEVGEFIPAAARYAHEAGLEFYIEFKPFDQFFPQLVPQVSPKWSVLLVPEDTNLFKCIRPWRKGIPALGGAWQMGTLFAEEHPAFLMARNMTGLRKGIEKEPIGTIKFIKSDVRPTGITEQNLELYVSEDNYRYRKYEGKYSYADKIETRPAMVRGVNLNQPSDKTETVRVITLGGLDIQQPFVAFSTAGKAGAPDFANNYYKLIEIYSIQGEPIPFTYGLSRPETDQWYPPDLREKRFPDRGFSFGLSGNLSNDFSSIFAERAGYLDPERRVLGIAKGKNPYISVLSPAYPEVRRFWLDQIKEFIEAGVDGVEFRWSGHQDSIEQDAYGFNQPVVDEYKKRYGVNVLTEQFDQVKWRRLQGEYYTQFLREARDLLKQHGRKMMVDVKPNNHTNPENPQFLNIYLDWEQWFSFADGVAFKWVPPDEPPPAPPNLPRTSDKTFRSVADRYHLPTYYNVIPQVVFRKKNREQIAQMLNHLRDVGHQGFILYEAAGFMRAKSDGTFDILYPEIPQIIVPAVEAMNVGK